MTDRFAFRFGRASRAVRKKGRIRAAWEPDPSPAVVALQRRIARSVAVGMVLGGMVGAFVGCALVAVWKLL